ncbi:hypothetical protein L1887_22457 [Cichorium endivia]|nr:hypothetical protein L1887_22457 [Cichorium endivia]
MSGLIRTLVNNQGTKLPITTDKESLKRLPRECRYKVGTSAESALFARGERERKGCACDEAVAIAVKSTQAEQLISGYLRSTEQRFDLSISFNSQVQLLNIYLSKR